MTTAYTVPIQRVQGQQPLRLSAAATAKLSEGLPPDVCSHRADMPPFNPSSMCASHLE
jgi:hypothetical protein